MSERWFARLLCFRLGPDSPLCRISRRIKQMIFGIEKGVEKKRQQQQQQQLGKADRQNKQKCVSEC